MDRWWQELVVTITAIPISHALLGNIMVGVSVVDGLKAAFEESRTRCCAGKERRTDRRAFSILTLVVFEIDATLILLVFMGH